MPMCTWVLGGSQRPTGLIVGFRFKSRPWQDRDVLSKYQRTVIPVLITGLFWVFFHFTVIYLPHTLDSLNNPTVITKL